MRSYFHLLFLFCHIALRQPTLLKKHHMMRSIKWKLTVQAGKTAESLSFLALHSEGKHWTVVTCVTRSDLDTSCFTNSGPTSVHLHVWCETLMSYQITLSKQREALVLLNFPFWQTWLLFMS